jgi:DNA-binding response OmpR family regulator
MTDVVPDQENNLSIDKPKILLVEDDVVLRDVYFSRFENESFNVVVASDGEEALAKAVREMPDLIILDVMMPKISGFDVLDILRSTPETKNTKVVMMTALSQDSDKARGEKLNVNKYLIKSQVTLEDVVKTVKEVLNTLD